MIQLHENKSRIWFKILNADGSPIDGSSEHWTLPHRDRKGVLTTFPGEPCRRRSPEGCWYIDPTYKEASWLVHDPRPLYPLNSGLRLYIAQVLESPTYEEPGMIWVNRVWLLREATNLDLKPFGIHRAIHPFID